VSPPFLGDIIVCQTVIEEEARSLDIEVSSHFIHMVVHGFLHLLGYDHLNDEQENKMKSIENKVLAELGIKKETS
jgi:probable rRNA maturation factor